MKTCAPGAGKLEGRCALGLKTPAQQRGRKDLPEMATWSTGRPSIHPYLRALEWSHTLCPFIGSFLRPPYHQPSELDHSRSLTMRPNVYPCPVMLCRPSFQMISLLGKMDHHWSIDWREVCAPSLGCFLIPLSPDAYGVLLWAIIYSILTVANWCPVTIPTLPMRKLKLREVESHAQDTQQM